VNGITFFVPISTRSTRPLPDRYSTIHQRTRSGTSRVQARPSSGRAGLGNLGSWNDQVDLIGSGNIA